MYKKKLNPPTIIIIITKKKIATHTQKQKIKTFKRLLNLRPCPFGSFPHVKT